MAATLADYQVLMDGGFKLDSFGNGEETVDFNPPNDMILNQSGSRPILTFRVDPDQNADMTVTVSVLKEQSGDGEQLILTLPVQTRDARTVHEVLGGSQLHTGNLQFIFRANGGGSGRVSITDLILWYRRPV